MTRQLLVLLVEDDPFDERLALRAFASSSTMARIDVARDGMEAIDYLKKVANNCPDLVLLDLKLPKLHGQEVLEWIRANESTRLVPVICFSSSAERRDVLGCYASGANAFVLKAVDFDDYMKRFRLMVEFWLKINELSRWEDDCARPG